MRSEMTDCRPDRHAMARAARAGVVWLGASAVLLTVVGTLTANRLAAGAHQLAFVVASGLLLLSIVIGFGIADRRGGLQVERWVGLALVVVLLGLRFAPIVNGDLVSGRLSLGPLGSIQVGEFTRPLTIVALAILVGPVTGMLTDPRVAKSSYRLLVTIAAGMAALVCGALVLVGDFGPAVLMALGSWVVFARSHPIRSWIVGPILAGLVIVTVLLVHPPQHVAVRFHDTVFSGESPEWQAAAARAVVSHSGLIGLGFGSNPLVAQVPLASTDYVAVSVGGDLGLLVLLLMLLPWLLALVAAVRVLNQTDGWLAVAGMALSVMLAVQTVWMTLGPLGLLPVTGLPLPWLSTTGSSSLSSSLAVGVIVAALIRAQPAMQIAARPTPVWFERLTVGTLVVLLLGTVTIVVTTFAAPTTAPSAALQRLPRGAIITSDGVIIARTVVDVDGRSRRNYPKGATFGSVGWMTPSGSYGLERSAADALTCGGTYTALRSALSDLLATPCATANVVATLRNDLQEAALTGISPYSNATTVVMDATNGQISADVSTGRPDPNQAWDSDLGTSAVDGPLGAPSRIESSAPGSVFKLVVATAALQMGLTSTPDLGSEYRPTPTTTVHNEWLGPCPDSTVTTMLARSCNTTAAYLAVTIGPDKLNAVAKDTFGFDQDTIAGLTVAPSVTGLSSGAPADEVARTGFGQQNVRVTPLGLTEAIARIVAPSGAAAPTYIAGFCDGQDFQPFTPPPFSGAELDPTIGNTLLSAMSDAVTSGTARSLAAAFPGEDLAAKTGSADVSVEGQPGTDSWVVIVLDGRWVVTTVVHATPADLDPAATGAATIGSISAIRKLTDGTTWQAPSCTTG